MSGAPLSGRWSDLERPLRAFVARRVRAEHDVDDVVQEVFLRVQRGLAGLRSRDRFAPWLYRIARNAIADHARAGAKRRAVEIGAIEDVPERSPVADSGAKDLLGFVGAFVDALPPPFAEAVRLTELDGLTQEAAAARVGVPLSTMKSRVQRGRVKLKRSLEACCTFALDARGRVTGCERRPEGRAPGECCP